MRFLKVETLLNSRFVILILFLFISIGIVSTWFSNNIFYGGAEVGIVVYNSERWLESSENVWWGSSAPGQLIPHFIVGIPHYFFFSVLQSLGFSAPLIQQFLFTILFFLIGSGAYLLAFDILEEQKKKYALLAGLFYSFNVYILVQVWHRFLYSTYILAAILPFLLLFWRRWIRKGNPTDLIIFLLINFVSVYMYGNLASVITVWTALMLLSLSEIIFPWQGKQNFIKIGLRFLGGFIFWILTNIWWILPTFLIAPGLLATQHSNEDSLGTLIVISTQTILPFLLQLVNPYFLFYQSELGQIYSNFFFKIIPWIIFFLVSLGFFISLRTRKYAKYGIIYLTCLLLAKGAAMPFSYPYIFAFKHIFILGVLRNPFEKLGILLPVFGALLFSIGMIKLFEWFNLKWGRISAKLIFIVIIVILVGYAWPIFGGGFFGTEKLPIKVIVPDSYTQANKWLHEQKDDQGVILHLPFSGKDVLTYIWDQGYHGVDHNEILFTSLPSLSRPVGVKRVDDTLNILTSIFIPPITGKEEKILKTLQSFNVRYIVLHKDIDWEDKDTYSDKGLLLNPQPIEEALNSLDFLEKKQEFGQLIIYKLSDQFYKPTIFISDDVQIIYPGKSDITQITSFVNTDSLTPLENQNIESVGDRQLLVFPDERFEYFEASRSSMINSINNIFINPNSSPSVVQLLQLRNYFYSIGYIESEGIIKDLILSTEKILLLYKQAITNGLLPSKEQVDNYEKLMSNIFTKYSSGLTVSEKFSANIADILRLHLFIHQELNQTKLVKLIEDNMVKSALLPMYRTSGFQDSKDMQIKRYVFKFIVPEKGEYQLFFPNVSNNLDIRINNGKVISTNILSLEKDIYEISYNSLENSIKEDPVLISGSKMGSQSAELVEFKKESTVGFRGRINIAEPGFVFFAQTYHPGWTLTLIKSGNTLKVKDHFIGNLYSNAWWISEQGEYNFNIEFTPQQNVGKGIILAGLSAAFLILLKVFTIWKRFFKK